MSSLIGVDDATLASGSGDQAVLLNSDAGTRCVADTSMGAFCRAATGSLETPIADGPRSARGRKRGFSENEIGADYPALLEVPDFPWLRFSSMSRASGSNTALDPPTAVQGLENRDGVELTACVLQDADISVGDTVTTNAITDAAGDNVLEADGGGLSTLEKFLHNTSAQREITQAFLFGLS